MDELESIVAEMRRLGVTKYKKADIEIELGPENQPEAVRDPNAERRKLDEAVKRDQQKRFRTMFGATSVVPLIGRR